ncbi:MAG: chemotaxis response regulator protein-glutamate methylesterase [Pseudomonadota bacterium]|nr:chemotaxis response regulator protein-glutamate methylesterase [Pseudomonadota bacterium]
MSFVPSSAQSSERKVRVLVIDDSALVRKVVKTILQQDPDIEVVGAAADPYLARDKIKLLQPDVLTLDVEMPRMDGATFLRNIMRLRPMLVIMVSTHTTTSADITLEALALGAVDFVTKPHMSLQHTVSEFAEELIAKVKVAAKARLKAREAGASRALKEFGPRLSAEAVLPRTPPLRAATQRVVRIIAIGASTGGTEAIKDLLSNLPEDAPATVIAQHIPESFSEPFARRLNGLCALQVCEAHDGQEILPGHAYVAPGSHHLMVVSEGSRLVCLLSDGPPVNRHRPSVDVLFRSVAQSVGPNALGVILTGMGSDGAQGLLEMREAGAGTMAQDEETSVVWGMPKEGVKLGGVDRILPLDRIAKELMALVADRSRPK